MGEVLLYGTGIMFWLKLLFALGLILLLASVFNAAMANYLNVEKTNLFMSNHVNELHKKIDWIIRISFVIILLGTSFFVRKNPEGAVWYLQTWFVVLAFLMVSEIIRAFMEWKYSENPKTYILTISQLIFVIVLLWVGYTSRFFKLF